MGVYGTGTYGAGTYGTPSTAAPYVAHVRERPPTRLHIDTRSPSGQSHRWAHDAPSPHDLVTALRFSSTMPGGHETLDCTLARRPQVDWPDLKRLTAIRAVGAGGETAWEGRLEGTPRSSGDELAITPSAVGNQAYLEDDKSATQVYVDRDLTRWTGPSVQRKLDLPARGFTAAGDVAVTADPSGLPALQTSISDTWDASRRKMAEGWYDAGPANKIALLYYAWKRDPAKIDPALAWVWSAFLSDDDVASAFDTPGNLKAAGPGAGTLAASVARRFALVQLYFNGAGGAVGDLYPIYWTVLAVYGNHGLTLHSTNDAPGLKASDIAAHAVTKWAPTLKVSADSIDPSDFVIPHITFLEPTTAGEIVRQAARFGLNDWAVWDDHTFYFRARGSGGRKWNARIGPAQLEETGPRIDRLWESVIVAYQDVDGTTKTAGPPGSGAHTEDPALKDPDPENPANQAGIVRRDMLTMGTSTAAAAVEIGRRFLQEQKLLDSSGRARLVGHVADSAGVVWPAWAVRAGDTISFADAADSSYRRIVRADYDHGTRACSVDLDSPPEGLAALLERLNVVLVPLGV